MSTPERRKAEQLQERADKLQAEYERTSKRAFDSYGRFAGGQPLLVGHHSYKSALRDRKKADAISQRSIDLGKEAKLAQSKADGAKAVADLADIEAARSRDWRREDFLVGDTVWYRDFRRDMATTSRGKVKRVNAKTLTLDGGGGGWDDPKTAYDRILSRTRDGATVRDPDVEDAEHG